MQTDAYGNYNEKGHKYEPSRPFDDIPLLIKRDLEKEIPDIRFSMNVSKFAGGRSINIDITDAGPHDISTHDSRSNLEERVTKIADAFNFSNGNIYSDHHSTRFYCHVKVAGSAFAAKAEESGAVQNPVAKKMTLSEFKRTLKPGHRLDVLHGTRKRSRLVHQVRSKDIVFTDLDGTGKSYLDFGRAADFACDGELVRFAIGNEYEPDAHLLYRWTKS